MHCHRCKAAILPGETIVRYNKPAPGTPYHRTCPNGAVPESQASAPKAAAAPPIMVTGQPDIAAIVAAVTAALTAQRPAPAPAPEVRGWEGLPGPVAESAAYVARSVGAAAAPIIPEPEPVAEEPEGDEEPDNGVCACCGRADCPNCEAHVVLVSKGYEKVGFDCPARGWFPERTFDAACDTLLRALDVYSDRNGTSPLVTGGHVAAWNDLFADAAEGLTPRDLKRLLDWHQGVAAGVRAVIDYRGEQYRRTRAEATGPDAARARAAGGFGKGTGTVPLTLLVDDEQAAAQDAAYQAEKAATPTDAPAIPEEE